MFGCISVHACVHPTHARLIDTEQGQSVLVLETGEDEHLNPLTRWGYFFPSVRFFGVGLE